MHWDFSVINWSKRNSINIVQERWLTTSWGIYTQQPYDPSVSQTCMCECWRMLTCSLLTTWMLRNMLVLSNIFGKQFAGTERSHCKGFCDVWFWSRHSFLSLSCRGIGFRKLVQEFPFFISIYIVYSSFLFYLHFSSCGAYLTQKNTNRIELTYRMRFVLLSSIAGR